MRSTAELIDPLLAALAVQREADLAAVAAMWAAPSGPARHLPRRELFTATELADGLFGQ